METKSKASVIFLIILSNFLIAQPKQEIKKEYYPSGKISNQYSYIDGTLNGPYYAFYEDEKKWVEGNYRDGNLSDSFKIYTPKGELASIDIYHSGTLFNRTIFWQELPNSKFVFVSKNGFTTIQNGNPVTLDSSTPDGIVEIAYDEKYNEITYLWKGGKRTKYEGGKPNGTLETRFEGEKAGIYEWQDGKLNFLRALNKQDLEEKKRAEKEADEMLKIMNLQDTTKH